MPAGNCGGLCRWRLEVKGGSLATVANGEAEHPLDVECRHDTQVNACAEGAQRKLDFVVLWLG